MFKPPILHTTFQPVPEDLTHLSVFITKERTTAAARDLSCPVDLMASLKAPHKCAFGLACTARIEDMNFHRRRVLQLNATATNLGIPVHPVVGSVQYFRHLANSIAWDLSVRGVDVMEVLRAIQSPEYWDVEKSYLTSKGCLERQQKTSQQNPQLLYTKHQSAMPVSRSCSSEGPLATENDNRRSERTRYTTRGKTRKAQISVQAQMRRPKKSSNTTSKIQRKRREQKVKGVDRLCKSQANSTGTRSRLDLRGVDIRALGLP